MPSLEANDDEAMAVKRALSIHRYIHEREYIKSHHLADRLDISTKAASSRMKLAEEQGWVSVWATQSPKTWKIEL